MSSKNVKKYNTWLTNQQKAEIYQKVKEGISRAQLCTDYDICYSTVSNIMQDERYNLEKQVNPEVKKMNSVSSHILKEELHDWCLQREMSKATTSYKQLREKAKEIIKENGEGPSNLHKFLYNFQINYKIQLVFSVKTRLENIEVDEQLLNWLLERMIKKESISKKIFKDKTNELMKKSDVPLNTQSDRDKARVWLYKFKKCHKILTEPDVLEKFIQNGDETNQSDKNLDEQLLDWLLRRKRSGETISHEILTCKAQKLLDNFDGSKKMDEENWLCRINKRYLGPIPKSYKPEILQSRVQRSHETAGTSKLIVKNVTEEEIVIEKNH